LYTWNGKTEDCIPGTGILKIVYLERVYLRLHTWNGYTEEHTEEGVAVAVPAVVGEHARTSPQYLNHRV